MDEVGGGRAALGVLAFLTTVAGVEGVARDLDLRVEGVGGLPWGEGMGFLSVSPRSENDGLT